MAIKNNNTIEDELDRIRVSLYEETKDMTSSERITYIKAQTEPILKKHGIKPVHGVHAKSDGNNRAVM